MLDDSEVFDESSSNSAQSNSNDPLGLSSLFNTGDQVLTQSLIQGASSYFADGLSSIAGTISGRSGR